MWPFVTHFIRSASCFWGSPMVRHVNAPFWAKICRMCEVCVGEIILIYLFVSICSFWLKFPFRTEGLPPWILKDPHFQHLPTCHFGTFQLKHLLHLLRKFLCYLWRSKWTWYLNSVIPKYIFWNCHSIVKNSGSYKEQLLS